MNPLTLHLEQPNTAQLSRATAEDIPTSEMSVRVLSGQQLAEQVDAWQRLVETAIEPNIFYEPCVLLPALETLAENADLSFVVVEAHARKFPERTKVWCGLFPLERKRRAGGVSVFHLWMHPHCYLCTPLLRGDVASEALAGLFGWFDTELKGRWLLKLDGFSADGPFHEALVEHCQRNGLQPWLSERHTRALFRRAASAEDFLLASMPRKRRHELKRLARRLAEHGRVELKVLTRADNVDDWVDAFLELEARGWKGASGTALSCSNVNHDFFRRLAQRAFAADQLMMLMLMLDGRPIAAKCNLLTRRGSFAFKISFDEELSRFSPGALLEIHNITALHEQDEIPWMDSCAAADHPMINQLWSDRRVIESSWIAGSALRARLALSLFPLARTVRDCLRKRPPTQKSTETLDS